MANQRRINLIVMAILAAGLWTGVAAAEPPRPQRATEVWVKVDQLKAVFKATFNADLNVNDYRGVSLAVNRWLGANKRGDYAGFWNYEDRRDDEGSAIYDVVMFRPDSMVDIPVDQLKVTFKKAFNVDMDVYNLRAVSLAVNRWLTANKRGDFAGLWNGEEEDDGHGGAVYSVVLFKPDADVDIRVDDLAAVYQQQYGAALDAGNLKQVGLAVNRWLTAHNRGQYNGFWNGEEGDDGHGHAVYSVALIQRVPDNRELGYVANSTKKICQLTGDTDRETGKPTLSQTGKRFGIEATDLGSSFEHKGMLYFLFGDTGPNDRDVLAWTKAADPRKIVLNVHTGKDGKWLPLTVPGIGQGAFEIPSGGVSLCGTMYVVCTTDHSEQKTMGRSVLASSHDDGLTFKQLYELSRTKFINVSFWPADNWLYIYGSGDYRKSNVFLARVKPAEIAERSKLQYFAGPGANGQPRWSPKEADAIPLFRQPQVGEFSVAYLDPVDRYVMLYNADKPRGITLRLARTPWGPWSEGTVIFEPWRDKGYGHFMHISATFKDQRDALSDPNRANEWGGEYGPYIMARYTTGGDGRCRIFYTMSTWNPYQVVVMRSDLELKGGAQ